MVRAIHRSLQFVARADGAAIAAAIAGFFPDVLPALLTTACGRYKALGIWGATPVLPRAGYDRLLSGLVSGGFVPRGTPFEVAVDNSLAEQVLAENPPLLD
jgi:NitT/TauT family transport system substrate-binding protein